MAKSAILLAIIVGLCTSMGAWAVGEVGLWGAVALYVGAGWAAILALLVVNLAGGAASRSGRLASEPAQVDDAIMVAKHSRTHR